MPTLDQLRLSFVELDEQRTLELVPQLLDQGASPLSLIHTCQQALRVVGERYEREEYFISGLIMAGELFKEVLEIVQPFHDDAPSQGTSGTILLGTVQGDIHDIGKNLFGSSLKSFDFGVIDLGVDIPPDKFLSEATQSRPDVICLSGLILTAFDSMKETVTLLRSREKDLGYSPPVIIGGATVDGRICEFCGADSWSTDAMEGVRICQRLVAQARK